MAIAFTVNGETVSVPDEKGDMPLLWYVREELGLKGTKFGCGIAQCGACTVHLNGEAVRSCVLPVSGLAGASVTTIEGLAGNDENLHPVQQAWIDVDVPQCGYCQAGQIMAAAALLERNPAPTDDDLAEGMTNLCRCGAYVRIRKAVKQAASAIRPADPAQPRARTTAGSRRAEPR